jgi:uncharacterized protein YjcR
MSREDDNASVKSEMEKPVKKKTTKREVWELRVTKVKDGQHFASQVIEVNDGTFDQRYRTMTNPKLATYWTYSKIWREVVQLMRAGQVNITTHRIYASDRKHGERLLRKRGLMLVSDVAEITYEDQDDDEIMCDSWGN